MAHRRVPARSVFFGIAAVAWPGFAVLAVLAVAGLLAPEAGLLGALAMIVALWRPIRRHVHELVKLAGALDDMNEEAVERAGPGRLRVDSALIARPVAAALSDAATGLRRRYRRLLVRHHSLESLVEHLPNPVIAIDGERRIVRVASGIGAEFGSNPVGSDLASVLRDPGVLEAAERVAGTGRTEAIDFIGGPTSDAALSARIVGLAEAAPDGTRAVIEVANVTDAKRIERARSDFIANASHELRTPLSVLLGCVQTLRGPAREDGEARERFLEMMEEQAGRMSRLVADLLSLSKIELSEHQAHSASVALSPVLDHVRDASQFAARSRGMTIAIESAREDGVVIGDRDELIQLFQNLIDNAVKYGRRGSTVGVTVEQGELDGTRAMIVSVGDEGEGIAAEHLGRLTERFYRVDAARSRELGGTGLGLAIVKHIIGRHRGRLDIESTPGAGSTFRVSLPAAESDG